MLTDMEESLVEVGHDGVLINYFVYFAHLEGTYLIDNYKVVRWVFAANSMLIDFFKLADLILGEIILWISKILLDTRCGINRKMRFTWNDWQVWIGSSWKGRLVFIFTWGKNSLNKSKNLSAYQYRLLYIRI